MKKKVTENVLTNDLACCKLTYLMRIDNSHEQSQPRSQGLFPGSGAASQGKDPGNEVGAV